MEVTEGLVVVLDFTLTDPAGQVIETTSGAEPITFQFGTRSILPGLAKTIEGMKVGETRTGKIPAGQLVPRDALGKRHVPKAELPAGASPKVGDRFTAKEAGHAQPVTLEVVSVDATGIDVQLLHPLHLIDVGYEVVVRAIRRPNVPPPPPVAVEEDLTDAVLEDVEG
ncbi:FKBP-type peptidyl-prolyl cis-trans isomerase [Myxococcota bacterium]|nr:FKBP-type peptidyl-prolyl cis-trans isomerase [Myxococcota bacterium]